MSENQPTFKVTDRRLFNPDGSPRELTAEEQLERPLESANTPVVEQPPPESPKQPTAQTSIDHEPVEPSAEEEADARDPASFLNFLMSIASNAASALGMMEHPVTHQRDVDLELGKHWIDVIGMLQKKTRGNLTRQEQQMIEGLLADLRMQYVSLTSAPQKAQRFSGSDITGGR